jgi:hypothetical protein
MKGVEGTLVRRTNGMRIVLSIALINQHAALEADAKLLILQDHGPCSLLPSQFAAYANCSALEQYD